jgi:hypothetical protein
VPNTRGSRKREQAAIVVEAVRARQLRIVRIVGLAAQGDAPEQRHRSILAPQVPAADREKSARADVQLIDRAAAIIGRLGDAPDFDAAAIIDGRRRGFFDFDQHVPRQRPGARQLADADPPEQAERRQPALALEQRLVAHRIAGAERQLAADQVRRDARVAGDEHVIDLDLIAFTNRPGQRDQLLLVGERSAAR